MRLLRYALAIVTAAAVAVPVGIGATPAPAVPSEGLIISEVYTRGGSHNQPYKKKFVEIYNAGSGSVDLAGKSLQYRAAAASVSARAFALSGRVEPGGTFVVGTGSNGNVGADITTDLEIGMAPSGTSGVIVLASTSSGIPLAKGSVTDDDRVIDLVGYGTASTFETGAVPYRGANSTPGAIARSSVQDTDDNSVDFAFTTEPTPGTVPWESSRPEPAPPAGADVTIGQIQGTGAASGLTGKRVTTKGVVTGTHFSGGFHGFYLMDENAKLTDRTPADPSDGIFVYTGPKGMDVTIGDRVTLSGTVEEYYSLTQLTRPVLVNKVPGQPLTPVAYPFTADDRVREAYESMLVAPQGDYVISDNYAKLTNYGSLKLAYSAAPLVHPGELFNPVSDPEKWAAQDALKTTHTITLDDGKTTNFSAQTGQPLSYIEAGGAARVGAAVEFKNTGVLLDYRFGAWNFQPTSPVDGDNRATEPVTFGKTRTAAASPVAGNVKLASFNVLNYFTDLGEDEPGCKSYTDREGNPTTANRCKVRGAYSKAAFERQQAKIVTAINKLGADLVALEEIEVNSVVDPSKDRDGALSALVEALNDKAGTGVWAFAPSPTTVPSGEDVIRTAYIYRPAAIEPVGESAILDDPAFHNARRPLKQTWKILGVEAGDGDTVQDSFTTVVNHFKSKGSGVDDGTNQGKANPDRIAQAKAVASWTGDSRLPVILVGDFNAYTKEDPMQVLYGAGYTDLGAHFGLSKTYLYGGQVGSLDHVLADERALGMVKGATVWNINSVESILLEYSRFNSNVKELYTPDQYRSSDHDPVIVGIDPIVVKASVPTPDPTHSDDPTAPGKPTASGEPTIDQGDSATPSEAHGRVGMPTTGTEILGIVLLALVLLGAGIALVWRRYR